MKHLEPFPFAAAERPLILPCSSARFDQGIISGMLRASTFNQVQQLGERLACIFCA
jgi:hypothetical protein